MRPRARRDAFRQFLVIPTRWMDNDVYGHVNNVVYYSYFDTVVNEHLIREGGLDIVASSCIGVVAETACRYHAPLAFPQLIDAGIRVAHLGRSSVRYAIGLFAQGDAEAAAEGDFVHVWIDRASGRPGAIPDRIRAVLLPLLDGNA
jgi:acyl-CoA thioester hydrolase